MKTKLLSSIILLLTSIFTYGIDLLADCPEHTGNYTAHESNYLDIIIDESHAYVFLSCSDCNEGFPYSVYASLMPTGDAPKIIQWLEDGPEEPVAEYSYDNSTYAHTWKFPNGTSLELKFGDGDGDLRGLKTMSNGGFVANFSNGNILSYGVDEEKPSTLKAIGYTIFMGIGYIVSDYIGTAKKGEIINDSPNPSEVKVRKRFYLTSEVAREVFNLINQSFEDSANGKIIYDGTKHNCIDFAKEIYEAAGLDKTKGEFLDQLDLNENCVGEDCTILNTYRVHNEGAITNKLSELWRIFKEMTTETS